MSFAIQKLNGRRKVSELRFKFETVQGLNKWFDACTARATQVAIVSAVDAGMSRDRTMLARRGGCSVHPQEARHA